MIVQNQSEEDFMDALVGYTGFVGSNISLAHKFDCIYNSKNIENSFGTNPDLLVYSGIRAEKFLANRFPKQDFENIKTAIENIEKINPKKIVLISTVDVYKIPMDVNEESEIITDGLNAYGFNRYYLEKWVESNIKNHIIVRLPALYGKNLKKNFIFDMINMIPSVLNQNKYNQLNSIIDISDYYTAQQNGFYNLNQIDQSEKQHLKVIFKQLNFSSLNFTDSRAKFQFYNLKYLWSHIEKALNNNINKLNICTEPICVSVLYKYVMGKEFKNEINDNFAQYNMKTKYTDIFEGEYIFDSRFVLEDIKKFVEHSVDAF